MAANWDELSEQVKEQMLNLATSGQLNVSSVSDLDGISQTYWSPSELISFYNEFKNLAQAEEDAQTKPKWRPFYVRKSSFRR